MATPKKPATTSKKDASAKPVTPKTAKTKATAAKTPAKAKPNRGKVEGGAMASATNEFADLKGKAGERAREAADRGKEKASEALGGIGKILRDSAGTIDEKVGAEYGEYARKAADAVDEFAGKLDAKQVDEMLEDTRQFVRKSPAVAIGAAAALGFVLARLVRSGRD